MSNTTNTETKPAGKAPSHVAYQVRESANGKGYWVRIGSAWANGDGNGFNIQLDSVPIDGRITLRVVSEKKD